MSAMTVDSDDDGSADEEIDSTIRDALRRSLSKVVELLSLDAVLDLFVERSVFGEHTRIIVTDIRGVNKPSEKNRIVHEKISVDSRRYKEFKECLAITQQTDLLDLLEKAEEDVHNEHGRCDICKVTDSDDICKIMASLRCNREPKVYPVVKEAESVIRPTLQRSTSKFANLLLPDVVLDQFMERNVFGDYTSATVGDIRAISKPSDKSRAIHDRVSRDWRLYLDLKECLAASNQTDLLNALEKTEEDMHTEIKENRGCCICQGTDTCDMMISLRCDREIPQYLSPMVKGTQQDILKLYDTRRQKVPIFPLRPEWKENVRDLFVKQRMIEMNPRGFGALTDQKSYMNAEENLEDIRDIFYSGEKSYTNIYLVAESGLGKSTLCEFLVYLWVKEHSEMQEAGKSRDESFMKDFTFLFYVSLREANRNATSNIEDMIRHQFELNLNDEDMSKIIQDYPCLIILDGLDEYSLKHSWSTQNVSASLPWRRYKHKSTFLTTSRPWKMELLSSEPGVKIDRQIRITGLEKKSQEDLARTVVSKLNSISETEDKNFNDFIDDMEKRHLEKYMETPILLLQMLGLWFDGDSFGKSQCEIYSKMIDKQIQFAEEVKRIPAASNEEEPISGPTTKSKKRGYLHKLSKFGKRNTGVKLPDCFNGQCYCQKYQELLLKVSKLAYLYLFGSQNSVLVFDHDQMEKMGLSEEDIQNCLHLGLLTQYNVLDKVMQRRKSITFVHKSHQEFFAAIYLWQTGVGSNLKQLLASFTDLDRALPIEKVLTFVSGMSPDVSHEISKVITAHVSKDARVKQYRESSLYAKAPNEALVLQIQGLIISAIEESRNNGRIMPTISLQDICMQDKNRDFPSSRILACAQSLKLSRFRSIVIDTPSEISRDGIRQLVNSSSKLNKMVLRNCDISASSVMEAVNRNRGSLQAIGLYYYYVDALDFCRLSQRNLKDILSPSSFAVDNVIMSHEQLELMYTHLGRGSYTEVKLLDLHCRQHGDENCEPRLDLSTSTELRRLSLVCLPVQEVVFAPDKLVWCYIGDLPNAVSINILHCLTAASSLENILCYSLKEAVVVELVRVLSQLNTLTYIFLWDMDLRNQQQIVLQNMPLLKEVEMRKVTLTAKQMHQFLEGLPSHTVLVVLGCSDLQASVTITDYERNSNLIEQIAASPHTEVTTNPKVTYEDDKCVVKVFSFYREYKIRWS